MGGVNRVGAVNVLYGGAGGLSASGNQFWHQNSPGVLDASEDGDSFGRALTVGNFNGDGRDDLAVGVPEEDSGTSKLPARSTSSTATPGGSRRAETSSGTKTVPAS